jgi:hypothetical protein
MRGVQIFCCALFLARPATGEPAPSTDPVKFTVTDVDQHLLTVGDGIVTIIVCVSAKDTDKARLVGERVPDFCLGNPASRFITLVRFEKSHFVPAQAIVRGVVRRRLDVEAQRLQARYQAKGITRNARDDVFAVTDFDNSIGAHLDLPPGSTLFQVFIIGRKGEMLRHWTEVPTEAELRAALLPIQ